MSAVPLVEVRRGGVAEAVHRGHVALVDATGRLLLAAGDPCHITYMRSAAKPLQAVPVVESGAADRFGLKGRELAVMSASHSGETPHVEAVNEIMKRAGLEEESLHCGIHSPWHEPTREALCRSGGEPGPVYNNCSGKHAGMLALTKHMGWPTDGYTEPSHPVQQAMLEAVSDICGVDRDKLIVASDGCTAPTFAMPLYNMALGYARLAEAFGAGPVTARVLAMARVLEAMASHPLMVAGTGRFDTALISATGGRLVSKSGAEGLVCIAVTDKALGLAVKIEDGAMRGVGVAALEFLARAGLITPSEEGALAEYRRPPLYNRMGVLVGETVPLDWWGV